LNRSNLGDIPLLSNIGENISAKVVSKGVDYQQFPLFVLVVHGIS
jgi:hypothetical protein